MLKDIESFVKDDIKVNRLVYGCTKNEEYCAQALTELRDIIKQKDTVIENLKETLEENIKQIEDFKKQIEIITQHLDELYHQNVGVSYSVGKQMTAYYKEGMRYMINREDLGKRVTGYMFYDADSKGFTGLTEKQIKDTLNKGERLYGLVLDGEGNITMDTEGFKTNNYMVRSGINSLVPAVDSDMPANMMYVVVGMKKVQGGENVYEVISSRYARLEMPESKIKMLLEFGCVQGGVYLDGKGKLTICEGVRVDDGKEVG